ncbi:hypothetical protein BQ8794_50629 [Mesorhizobium prunaredense]|uniref:Uncharacterized protein n=1 Tax=Mesorhizobium prunaredense TaxID=1631249 RepID=A0A1R3VF38_9HYPH|nr:hypothetical protein BQ8794_50629 [Mesorhizobium prunaredense]
MTWPKWMLWPFPGASSEAAATLVVASKTVANAVEYLIIAILSDWRAHGLLPSLFQTHKRNLCAGAFAHIGTVT